MSQAKYIYIVAAGHSGSTLLDLLLGSHSKIESLGEISHFPKNVALNTECTCGKLVRDCSLWSQVIDQLSHLSGKNLLEDPYAWNMGLINPRVIIDKSQQTRLYNLKRKLVHSIHYSFLRYGPNALSPYKKLFDSIINNKVDLYNVVREIKDVDMVVDSSKTYLQAVELYRRHPESVRVIVLMRDGRGVYYSNVKRKYRRQQGVSIWKNIYSRALPLLDNYVDDMDLLYVKYEDVAANPCSELTRICGFLGLEFEPEMLNYTSAEHHNTNGNGMRFGASSEIRLDTSWREHMTVDDKNYFEKKAGVLNRRLGYQD
jgi:hypothetical protein